MANKFLKNTAKTLLVVIPASAIAGLIIFYEIANKNIPYHSDEDLKEAKYNLDLARQDAEFIFNEELDKAKKAANSNPNYKKAHAKVANYLDGYNHDQLVGDYTKATERLNQKRMDIRDSLINEYLKTSEALNYNDSRIDFYEKQIAKLEKNKAVADSLLKISAKKRFDENWAEFKKDFHTNWMNYHKRCLEKQK